MRYYEISQSILTEGIRKLKISGINLDIDMDHLMQRMFQRAVGHHEVDKMLKQLPTLLPKIAEIEAGQQFWIWNPTERIGLGFRKLNDSPKIILKTAVSSRPYDLNPVIITDN